MRATTITDRFWSIIGAAFCGFALWLLFMCVRSCGATDHSMTEGGKGEFLWGLVNWFAQVIPALVWAFVCLALFAKLFNTLNAIHEKLEAVGAKEFDNWFVVTYIVLGHIALFVLLGGAYAIATFAEAHQWGS